MVLVWRQSQYHTNAVLVLVWNVLILVLILRSWSWSRAVVLALGHAHLILVRACDLDYEWNIRCLVHTGAKQNRTSLFVSYQKQRGNMEAVSTMTVGVLLH